MDCETSILVKFVCNCQLQSSTDYHPLRKYTSVTRNAQKKHVVVIISTAGTDPEFFWVGWLLILNYAKAWWVAGYSNFRHLCNRKTARTKTIVVANLISHKQLCRNSLHSSNKVVFKATCLLQRCLNLL